MFQHPPGARQLGPADDPGEPIRVVKKRSMTRGVPWWAQFFGVREGKANAEFKSAENGRLQERGTREGQREVSTSRQIQA
jgi:hypothetical protein